MKLSKFTNKMELGIVHVIYIYKDIFRWYMPCDFFEQIAETWGELNSPGSDEPNGRWA